MTAVIVVVAILAVMAASALIGLTTVPHGASIRSSRAAASVRTAEGMQRNLLLHDRISDRAARAEIADRLREQLVTERGQIAQPTEERALDEARRAVDAYLTADAAANPPDDTAVKRAAAFAALEQLVAVEIDESEHAALTVNRYDELADAVGATVAAVVVVAAGFMVWWLRSRALRPFFELADKMTLFGKGNVDVRASEEGPSEVAQMARQFNEMASAIAQQRKERQTFIAGVVHDLRNPLSVLRMSTDVVRSGKTDLPPERTQKVLDAVCRQIDRLERMVGDLLDSVSIEAGNVRLRLEQHDARAIAKEIADLYAPTSPAHEIQLELPSRAVPLRCDAMRVEQVLSNLVSNAIKYSPRGGKVSVEVQATEGEVAFVVRDEGVGMSEEDAAKAFEPFQRGQKLQDQVPGSGLGLFVVRRLVEAHGGHIDLQTQPGRGTTFEVHLPAMA